MGRRGSLSGDELADDIATGSWRTKLYQVPREPLPDNPNWFAVSAFVERLQEAVQLDAD